MVTADIAENELVKLLKEFSIFERNKAPEIKLTAIAVYLLYKLEELLYSLTGIYCPLLEKFKDAIEFEKRSESL